MQSLDGKKLKAVHDLNEETTLVFSINGLYKFPACLQMLGFVLHLQQRHQNMLTLTLLTYPYFASERRN